jgi:hypothetical protein
MIGFLGQSIFGKHLKNVEAFSDLIMIDTLIAKRGPYAFFSFDGFDKESVYALK